MRWKAIKSKDSWIWNSFWLNPKGFYARWRGRSLFGWGQPTEKEGCWPEFWDYSCFFYIPTSQTSPPLLPVLLPTPPPSSVCSTPPPGNIWNSWNIPKQNFPCVSPVDFCSSHLEELTLLLISGFLGQQLTPRYAVIYLTWLSLFSTRKRQKQRRYPGVTKPFRVNKSGAHLAPMSGGVETWVRKENTFLLLSLLGASGFQLRSLQKAIIIYRKWDKMPGSIAFHSAGSEESSESLSLSDNHLDQRHTRRRILWDNHKAMTLTTESITNKSAKVCPVYQQGRLGLTITVPCTLVQRILVCFFMLGFPK